MTGIPKEIRVTYSEIAYALGKSVSKIEEATIKVLEMAPLNYRLIVTPMEFI
jgi:rod shape-determining protein MreB